MLAATLSENGFSLNEVDVPQPKENEVLIQTIGCGICGGDLHVYKTRSELSRDPLLLGHEGSGIIIELGEGVSKLKVGDKVTSLGGAYADFFVAHEDTLVKLPNEVDPLYALGEPLACCVHASDRFGTQDGDKVAVVGCGFMGLICLQLAKLQGASQIVAIDPVEYRREMAYQLGADICLHPDEVSIEDPWQGDFQVVIEATGVQSAVDLCSELVKHHGSITLVGYHESNDGIRSINMKLWNYKAINVINGHVRNDNEKLEATKKAIELLRLGLLVTEPLVHEYPLAMVESAFEDFESNKPGLFKAVLTPSNNEK